MASDLTNTIVDELIRLLTLELKTNIPTSDPLRVKIVDRGPLQDDPTAQANTPYVFVNPDPEEGTKPDEDLSEIGGISYFVDRFVVTARAPVQTKKVNAHQKIGTLRNRILAVLKDNQTLGGIANDAGDQAVIGSTPQGTPVVKSTIRVFGGEDNWLSECRIELSYRWVWNP